MSATGQAKSRSSSRIGLLRNNRDPFVTLEMANRYSNTSEDLTPSHSIDRKLIRYVVIFLVVTTAPVFVHQSRLNSRRARIALLGGEVRTGPPPFYRELAYSTRRPKFIRTACKSRFGGWLFSQFSVIYSADLRAIKNEDHLEEALQILRDCDRLSELTLYQAPVTDSHMELFRTGFARLERLKLNETLVTDAGIGHLRALRSLTLLNLQRTDLSNESVPVLASLPRLKELSIGQTRIDNIKAIRDARPGCFINTRVVTLKQSTDFHRVNARRTN